MAAPVAIIAAAYAVLEQLLMDLECKIMLAEMGVCGVGLAKMCGWVCCMSVFL